MRTSCLCTVIAISLVGELQSVPIIPIPAVNELLSGAPNPLGTGLMGSNVHDVTSQTATAPGLVQGLTSSFAPGSILGKRDASVEASPDTLSSYQNLPQSLPGLSSSAPFDRTSVPHSVPSSPDLGSLPSTASAGGVPNLSSASYLPSVAGAQALHPLPVSFAGVPAPNSLPASVTGVPALNSLPALSSVTGMTGGLLLQK
mgnify:CR=1 FL=1